MKAPIQIVAARGVDWRSVLNEAFNVTNKQARYEFNPTSAALRRFLNPEYCRQGRLAVLGGYQREGVSTIAYLHAYAWLEYAEIMTNEPTEVWISNNEDTLPYPQEGRNRLDIIDSRQLPYDVLNSILPVKHIHRLVLTDALGAHLSAQRLTTRDTERERVLHVGGLTRSEAVAHLMSFLFSLGIEVKPDVVNRNIESIALWRKNTSWVKKQRCRILLGVAQRALHDGLAMKGIIRPSEKEIQRLITNGMQLWASKFVRSKDHNLRYILEIFCLLTGCDASNNFSTAHNFVQLDFIQDLVARLHGIQLSKSINQFPDILFPDVKTNRLYILSPSILTATDTNIRKLFNGNSKLIDEIMRRAHGPLREIGSRTLWLIGEDKKALEVLMKDRSDIIGLSPLLPVYSTSNKLRDFADRISIAITNEHESNYKNDLEIEVAGIHILADTLEEMTANGQDEVFTKGYLTHKSTRLCNIDSFIAVLRLANIYREIDSIEVFRRLVRDWQDCSIEAAFRMLAESNSAERERWMMVIIELFGGQGDVTSILKLWDKAHRINITIDDSLSSTWAEIIIKNLNLSAFHGIVEALSSKVGSSASAEAIAMALVRASDHPLTIALSMTLLTDNTDIEIEAISSLISNTSKRVSAFTVELTARILDVYGNYFDKRDRAKAAAKKIREICIQEREAEYWVVTRAVLEDVHIVNEHITKAYSNWSDLLSSCKQGWSSIVEINLIWAMFAYHEGILPNEQEEICKALSKGLGRTIGRKDLRDLIPKQAEPTSFRNPSFDAAPYFKQAKIFEQFSEFLELHYALREGLKIDPGYTPAWERLTSLYIRMLKPWKAAETIKEANRSSVYSPLLQVILAKLYFETNKIEECVKILVDLRQTIIPRYVLKDVLSIGSKALSAIGKQEESMIWALEYLRHFGSGDHEILQHCVHCLRQEKPKETVASQKDIIREFVLRLSNDGSSNRLRLALTGDLPALALESLRVAITNVSTHNQVEFSGHTESMNLAQTSRILREHSLNSWADVILGIHLAKTGEHIQAHSIFKSVIGRIETRPDLRFINAVSLLAIASDIFGRKIHHQALQFACEARSELLFCEWQGLGGVEFLRISTSVSVLQMLLDPPLEAGIRRSHQARIMYSLSFLSVYFPNDNSLFELIRDTLIADLHAELITASRDSIWLCFLNGLKFSRNEFVYAVGADASVSRWYSIAVGLIELVVKIHIEREGFESPTADAVKALDNLIKDGSKYFLTETPRSPSIQDELRAGEFFWNVAHIYLNVIGRPAKGSEALHKALDIWINAQKRLEGAIRNSAANSLGIELGFHIRRATDLLRTFDK